LTTSTGILSLKFAESYHAGDITHAIIGDDDANGDYTSSI